MLHTSLIHVTVKKIIAKCCGVIRLRYFYFQIKTRAFDVFLFLQRTFFKNLFIKRRRTIPAKTIMLLKETRPTFFDV